MATTASLPPAPLETRAQLLVARPMLALAGVMVTSMSSFYLLLSAVPSHAATIAGPSAAGVSTGILMAATILGEIVAPKAIARLGRRRTLALALVAMALPCAAAFAGNLALVFLGCALRGLGLGVLLVAACGLAARLAPADRRAEALGLYGLASAIPAIVCVPVGPWALATIGESGLGLAAAAAAVAALIGVMCLPAGAGEPEAARGRTRFPPLRPAAWPAIALGIGAVAIGAAVTLLPVAHPEVAPATIASGLLAQGLASAVARWASGRSIDRHGPERAIARGVAASIAGVLLLALPGSVAILAGMAVSGIAFGVLQGATLAQLLGRASSEQADGASALWNGAYDAGLGVGGLAVGVLASATGFAAAFVLTGAALAVAALATIRIAEPRRVPC